MNNPASRLLALLRLPALAGVLLATGMVFFACQTIDTPEVIQEAYSLEIDLDTPSIMQGETFRLPAVIMRPADLANEPIVWISRQPAILTVDGDSLRAIAPGTAILIGALQADTTCRDSVEVRVLPRLSVDSVRFQRASLDLTVGASDESLSVAAHPPQAPQGMVLAVEDSTVARLVGRKLQAVQEGETRVFALSKEDPSRKDTLRVTVFPAEQVESLRLDADTLRLYVNGESRRLTATLMPKTLLPRFTWSSAANAIAQVDAQGRVTPGHEGKTFVTVISRADSARKDSALIIVKKDTPRLRVGGDTIIARGATLTYTPEATQEYGAIVNFKWDLDGDGVFEDSSATLRAGLSYTYAEAKEYPVRFYVKDSEGNDTTVLRKVKAVNGRVVQITSPKDGATVNETPITVTWVVDGVSQSDSQALSLGANTITRTAQDSAGNSYSHAITVHLDQTSPATPVVKGPLLPVRTLNPQWTWTSGGGGNGTFRIRLDNADLTHAPTTTDTFHTVSTNLDNGTHTLYVQERDEAGNWSASGSFAIVIDTVAPAAPEVSVAPAALTNDNTPTWSWTTSTSGTVTFRYKLNSNDLTTGATVTTLKTFTPETGLGEGTFTLYVQEADAAGNWSLSGSRQVRIDLAPPTAPQIDPAPNSPLNTLQPRFTWRSGKGGIKVFRARVDTADLSGAPERTDSSYVPGADLAEGMHTVYVQERDSAGNWSTSTTGSIYLSVTGLAGDPGMGPVNGYKTALAVDKSGVPVLAVWNFLGPQGGIPISVFRKSGGNWEPLASTGMVDSTEDEAQFALGSDGTPYIGYVTNDGTHVKVLAYTGTTWNTIGNLSVPGLAEISIATDDKGVPYCAASYFDVTGVTLLKVWKYNGTNWNVQGDSLNMTGELPRHQLRVGPGGGLFVAKFTQGHSWISATVVAQTNGTWSPVGGGGSVSGSDFDLEMNQDGIPFIFYRDDPRSGGKMHVKKASGLSWVDVGGTEIFEGNPLSRALSFDPSGNVYLAFSDRDSQDKDRLTVLKESGNSWIRVNARLAAGCTYNPISLAVDGNAVPHVAFNDGTVSNRASVMKFSFEP